MQITRTSIYSGRTATKELNCTQEQIDAWLAGELIQNALPQLTAPEREFLMSGMTDEDWDQMFQDDG